MIAVRFIGAVLALVVSGFAPAQNYPVKPVRVVIPWPPGGSNDIVGRLLAQKLSETMGQQFVIDNRGGASGTIGSDTVAKSPADGYTIMVHSATHVANPHLYGKLPYDTLKDFVGIAPMSVQIGMLVVHPSLPEEREGVHRARQIETRSAHLQLFRQRQLRASVDGALRLDGGRQDDPRSL